MRNLSLPPLVMLSAIMLVAGFASASCHDDIEEVTYEESARLTVPLDAEEPPPPPPAPRYPGETEAEQEAVAEQEEMQQEFAEEAEQEAVAEQEEMQQEFAEEAEEAADESETLADEGERSETGTNIQVSGVDEPDVIKTDGQHFYVLNSDQLSVIRVSETGLELVAELPFDNPGYMHILGEQQLLLTGDTLLALRTIGFNETALWQRERTPEAQDLFWWWYTLRGERVFEANLSYEPITELVEIDVSDPANPWIRRSMKTKADLLGARLVNQNARVLFRAQDHHARLLSRANLQPLCEYESREAFADRVCMWRDAEPLIDPGDSDSLERPRLRAGSITFLLSFDLGATAQGLGQWGSVDIANDGGQSTVYASRSSLYVAQLNDARTHTEITRFDLSNPMSPRVAGTATARGRLINQFALSEFQGHLRVATTVEDIWPTESIITVYELFDRGLEQVSTLSGLGTTELIHAVRFLGDRAFVVTFREIDPLYIIDLSDPSSPVAAGELKLPGFSRYLHPLGNGRLLGIGQDADPNTGWRLGLQLSLFDVSDSFNPRLIDQVKPASDHNGPSYGWPEFDHRAFTYHNGIAYVPALLIDYWDDLGSGSVYAIAVTCDALYHEDAFAGGYGTFPVRVLPSNDSLYVLSWREHSFLLQEYVIPGRSLVQRQATRDGRVRVSRVTSERTQGDCD